jgi:hypothetical protein
MNLRAFVLLNETLLRIINENYSDLSVSAQHKVSMNLQNTMIRNFIKKHSLTGTREEANSLIMQWIEENAARFRQNIIAGKYDNVVEKYL